MKLAATSEEIDAQCALKDCTVNFVDYEVEVLPPSMSMFEKIALAARTCYRSEGESSVEKDKKLIAGCVRRGHTSVLEHGAISLYLNIRPDDATSNAVRTIIGNRGRPAALRQMWDTLSTLSSQRYAHSFNDPDIFSKHADEVLVDGQKLPKDADVALPVVVADVRAWRDILQERLYISDHVTGDPISWLITVCAAHEMFKLAPEMFADIEASIIRRIAAYYEPIPEGEEPRKPQPIEAMVLKKVKFDAENPIELDHLVRHFFGDDFHGIIAEEASPALSISIVLTTDRAVTHEHVRHRRDVGYSQESQRYVDYNGKGFEAMKFTCDPVKAPEGVEINPFTGEVAKDEVAYKLFEDLMHHSFSVYSKLREMGFPPECARKALVNDTRTKIVVTWLLPMGFMNFLRWRTEKFAQYDIRRAASMIIFKMLDMKHPFLQLCPAKDLQGFYGWMKDQNLFDPDTMKKFEELINDRLGIEEEVRQRMEEERKILEEKQLIEHERKMKEIEKNKGVVLDDHTVEAAPDPSQPPGIVKIGGESEPPPAEPVTEHQATVQFTETKCDEQQNEDDGPAGCCAPEATGLPDGNACDPS